MATASLSASQTLRPSTKVVAQPFLASVAYLAVFALLAVAAQTTLSQEQAAGTESAIHDDDTQSALPSLTIKLIDERGKEVVDAAVRAYGRIGDERIDKRLESNDQGTCIVPLPEGKVNIFWFTVNAPKKVAAHYYWRADNAAVTIPSEVEVRLLDGQPIFGVVVDEGGKPIPKVEIDISSPITWPKDDSHYFTHVSLVTDEDGQWKYDGAPLEPSELSIRANHVDYRDARSRGTKAPLTLTMTQGARFPGVVLDPAGQPILGARLRLGPDRFGTNEPQATTNDAGEFVLKNCKLGSSVVTVQADGYAPQLREVEVKDKNDRIEFRLEPGHKLVAEVVNEKGQPIAGATVVVDGWGGYRSLEYRDKTDAKGRVEWHSAPADAVRFDVLMGGYMASRDQILLPGDEVQRVTMYPLLEIAGFVIDKETEKPIDQFTIVRGQNQNNLRDTYWSHDEVSGFTGGKFEYRFDEPRLGWLLQVKADGYKPAISRVFKFDEGAVRYNFVLEPAKRLEGTVVDSNSQPVVDAQVVVASANYPAVYRGGRLDTGESVARAVTTDESGSFRATLPDEEDCLVVVTHDSGFAEFFNPAADESLQVKLEPWGAVEGNVLVGDQPLAKAPVMFQATRPRDGRHYRTVEYEYKTEADADGRFRFDRVISGAGQLSRVVVVDYERGSMHSPAWHTPITVPPSDVASATIGGTGRVVRGRIVVDREPEGLWQYDHAFSMSYHDSESGAYSRFVGPIDQSDGRFEIPDVLPGKYDVRCEVNAISADRRITGTLGRLNTTVEIPSLDESVGADATAPFDLGNIEIELDPTLEPGMWAPDFVIENSAGGLTRLNDFRGKFLFVNFWSTYSKPSLGETALCGKLSERFAESEPIVFLSVSTSQEIEAAWETVEEQGWEPRDGKPRDGRWIHGYSGPRSVSMARDYILKSYPGNYLIGPNGRVLAKNIPTDSLEKTLVEQLTRYDPASPPEPTREQSVEPKYSVTTVDRKLERVTDAEVSQLAVLLIDDSAPGYDKDTEERDNLIAFDKAGNELWRAAELNLAGGSGGGNVMAVDHSRKRIYVVENISDRISVFDFRGTLLFRILGEVGSCITLDDKTGNIWCSGGRLLSHGITVVFSPEGRELNRFPFRGVDIAYDSKSDLFWLVGFHRIQINRDGEIVSRIRTQGYCCSSVSINATTGEVWVAERDHPDVVESRNRLWLLGGDGSVLKEMDLEDRDPFTVECLPSSDALVSGYQTGMLFVTRDGKMKKLGDDQLKSISVSSDGKSIWAATKKELVKIGPAGIEKRIPFHEGQAAWVFAF